MNVGKEVRSRIALTSKFTRYKSSLLRLGLMGAVLLNIIFLPINLSPTVALAVASSPVNVWWPTDGTHATGVQPFKAVVDGLDVTHYDMYWQVDGGQENPMDNSYQDYQHKEASVDVSGWTWHGSGPYAITFTAKQGGVEVAEGSVNLYVNNGLPTQAPADASAAPAQAQVSSAPVPQGDPDPVHQAQAAIGAASSPVLLQVQSSTDPSKHTTIDLSTWGLSSGDVVVSLKDSAGSVVAAQQLSVSASTAPVAPQQVAPAPVATPVNSGGFYVDPNSSAAQQAQAWRTSRSGDASKMDVLAAQPTAKWLGNWSGDVQSTAAQYVSAAAAAGKTAVLVAYNIPQRDCGGYSAGGSSDYTNWIGALARGIGNNRAEVILEPDALAQIDCLSASDQQNRYQLLQSAVSILKSNANTQVYIDAGHSNWVSADTMAARLQKANIARADGFALDVSNFMPAGDEAAYGTAISQKVGGKHFIIDTSRDGNGSNGAWCNPQGMAIGAKPTTQTGNNLIDAFLWVKTPGESDGNCNGGPSAGTWWPDYALSLVK